MPAAAGINISELAGDRGVRECLQWFTREKQWINEIHLQLCRVPAPTFLEQDRAAWFQEQLRSFGWNTSIDRAGNVIAAHGDGAGRLLLPDALLNLCRHGSRRARRRVDSLVPRCPPKHLGARPRRRARDIETPDRK